MGQAISLEEALYRLGDKSLWLVQESYITWKKKATFIHPTYGSWQTLPKYVAEGHSHPKDGHQRSGQASKLTLNTILERLGDKASWLVQASFISGNQKATFIHPEYGEWVTNISTVISGHGHPNDRITKMKETKIEKYGSANGPSIDFRTTKTYKDLSGKVFGKIKVLGPTSSVTIWNIECLNCGKITTAKTNAANRGKGCDCRIAAIKSKKIKHDKRLTETIGKVFGKWSVLDISTDNKVKCQCECGTIRIVSVYTLQSRQSTNCGCTTPIYKTEIKCREIIEDLLGYKFIKKRFTDIPSVRYIELDGYCEELQLAFEYDGEQHYKEVAFGSNSHSLEKRKQRDALKDQYCLDKSIKLIRIPYTQKQNLCTFIKSELVKNGIISFNNDIGE